MTSFCVSGEQHPLPVYLAAGAGGIGLDDEGVSRIDLSHEYLRAAINLPAELSTAQANYPETAWNTACLVTACGAICLQVKCWPYAAMTHLALKASSPRCAHALAVAKPFRASGNWKPAFRQFERDPLWAGR